MVARVLFAYQCDLDVISPHFDNGNDVHEVGFVSRCVLSKNRYLDAYHLVKHVY